MVRRILLALLSVVSVTVTSVLGYLGPETDTQFLNEELSENNPLGNKMDLNYYVFTNGIDTAWIYMQTDMLY